MAERTITITNAEYGYTIQSWDDGAKTITVCDADGEELEFDGNNGFLTIAGSYDEEEPFRWTLAECIDSTKEWFADWNIKDEVADSIVADLTEWFAEYCISEEEAILDEITNLESWIDGRRNTIADLMKRNDMHRMTIAEQNRKINENVDRVLAINTDIEKLEEKIATLKSQLKGGAK